MWALGPSNGPTACAPASRRCALSGWCEGVPGGVPCAVVRGVWSQALVVPRLSVLRGGCWGPLPTCCGRGCADLGARPCFFGLHALQGAACHGGGWWPSRGEAFHRFEGRLVSGAVPQPAACPWGRAATILFPCVPGTGGAGMGNPATAPQRALLRAAIARCEGGGRASLGGQPCALVRGV